MECRRALSVGKVFQESMANPVGQGAPVGWCVPLAWYLPGVPVGPPNALPVGPAQGLPAEKESPNKIVARGRKAGTQSDEGFQPLGNPERVAPMTALGDLPSLLKRRSQRWR